MKIEITGGAGPYEAAAVAAIISRVEEEMAASRAGRPLAPRPPAWVRAYLGFHADDPLPIINPDPHQARWP
ncbi:MAG TPA: hypothetical protein VJR05_00625 [Acidimicrobiia bacterium]|nr:hypothetical protein [Acidimicrobiia bacterium]